MTKTKVPQLRFSGFSGEWKEDKIGRIMDVGSVYRIHQSDWKKEGIPFIRARDIVSYLKNRKFSSDRLYISEEKYEKLSKKTGIVKKGDVLVTGVGTIGKPFLINTNKPLYFKDGNIIWLKNNNKISPNFLFYNFLSPSVQKEIISFSGVGTVGTYTIDSAKKTKIILPINDEQQKIGSFFAKQDKLIELQTQKVDQLKKLKRGYLQKMFPQEGETVPRLRFSGFSGEWKEEKLVELLKIGKSGGTPSTRNKEFYKGEIPFLSIKDVTTSNGTIFDTEKHISQEAVDNSSTWIVPKNALTLSMYASVGSVAKFTTNIATSQAFFNMVFNENVFVDYMYHFLKYYDYCGKWNRLIAKGTQGNLNATDIKNIIVFVPKLDEQQKIGSFFAKIDKLIEEQFNKLDRLKQQKKAYLQKMFI